MEGMIEVHVVATGDRAYAETPEDAVCAARTLRVEARDGGVGDPHPLVRFYVDGRMIREVADAL